MSSELANLDATAQAILVRNKEITPIELVDAGIARIESVNPQLNAVITPLFDKARALAESDSLPDGPFRGVPFLLKDLVCFSEGDPIYFGMRALRDARFIAPSDSYLAAKFKAAGFVCLGKTNTPELGLNATTEPEAFGPSRNPWNPSHSTGGSSGGSTAAVASRMVPIAHVNDAAGSIRIPASECGLIGLKPSRGRVSLGPFAGDALHGLGIENVVCRSMRDTAAALDAVSGDMPGDPYAGPPRNRPFIHEVGINPGRLRVGLMKRAPNGGARLHPDCVAAVEDAALLMQSLGHAVEESHPAALDETDFGMRLNSVFYAHTVRALEQIGSLLGRKLAANDVELWTWTLAEKGLTMSADQYLSAIEWLQVWSRRVAKWWFDGFDMLLTPTIAAPPPLLGELAAPPDNPDAGWLRLCALIQFTPQFNVTGQPAISLPLYWNAERLPIGVQLVAPFGREDLLIRIASQLEQARPWNDRLPPVCASK